MVPQFFFCDRIRLSIIRWVYFLFRRNRQHGKKRKSERTCGRRYAPTPQRSRRAGENEVLGNQKRGSGKNERPFPAPPMTPFLESTWDFGQWKKQVLRGGMGLLFGEDDGSGPKFHVPCKKKHPFGFVSKGFGPGLFCLVSFSIRHLKGVPSTKRTHPYIIAVLSSLSLSFFFFATFMRATQKRSTSRKPAGSGLGGGSPVFFR